MDAQGSVTLWIAKLKEGDSQAAQKLWERYYTRLLRLASRKLRGAPRRVRDEEDVVQSVFCALYRGLKDRRYPDLEDRHDLWQLLLTITARKAADAIKREKRQKRGGGRVRGESAFPGSGSSSRGGGLALVIGREPSPEFAAMATEECERLLGTLHDEHLRCIAVAKLRGYTNAEIAEQRDCGLRTVERKLRIIRALWEKEQSG